MSVETFGKQLLEEVKEESLVDLFLSLRRISDNVHGTHHGVPVLNTFLKPFLQDDIDHYVKCTQTIDQPVIELCGVRPCSGRTQLLCYVIAIYILPRLYHDIALIGLESAVCLIDNAGTFPILLLSRTMRRHILASASTFQSNAPNDQEISSIIHTSLQHLHVFRPQTSASFHATVNHLPSHFLDDPTKHYSSNRRLAAIVISDLDAFYWQDRHASQEAKDAKMLEAQSHPLDHHPKYREKLDQAGESLLSTRYRSLASSLRQAQHLFDCPLIATTTALSTPHKSHFGGRRHLAVRPHLPSTWNNYCIVKLLVQRNPVPKFPPEITLEEAMREWKQRQAVVEQGGCSVQLDWEAADRWEKGVREMVGTLKGLGFRRGNDGVLFDEGP